MLRLALFIARSSSPRDEEEEISETTTVREWVDYISKPEVKTAYEKIKQKIMELCPGIEEYATNNYIGYRYKGHVLVYMIVQTKKSVFGQYSG